MRISSNLVDREKDKFREDINGLTEVAVVAIPSSFLIEVQKGNVPGHKVINISSHVSGIGTTFGDIWLSGGNRNWLTSPSTIEAISDNIADDASSTGARTITISGLDSDFNEISEDIIMNGTAVSSPTTKSFIRINEATVKDTGVYGSTTTGRNIGNIIIRLSGGGTIQSTIGINEDLPIGISQQSHYTIPNGKTGFLLKYEIVTETTKSANILYMVREQADKVNAPFSPVRIIRIEDGITGPNGHSPVSPNIGLPAKTDMWFAGKFSAGTGEITVIYEILLIDI